LVHTWVCAWQNLPMRSIQAILLVGLSLLACGSPPELTEEQRSAVRLKVRQRLVRLPKEMELTVDQYRKVKPIMAATRDRVLGALVDAKQGGRTLRTARRLKSELKTVRAATETQLRPILNDKQMGQFAQAIDDVVEIVRNARE